MAGALVAELASGGQNSADASSSADANSVVSFEGEASAPDDPLCLWYRRPAKEWVEALAVGNGRLGAMVFGDLDKERIQLNEDTLWAGGPYDPSNPSALEALPEARRLIFAGEYSAAQTLVGERMMARPLRQMPYQTVGDLWLTFADIRAVSDYRRELNLDTAIARVEYAVDGVHYRREIFASPVDQVIVIRLTADRPGRISFTAGMTTPQQATVKTTSPHTLVMSGTNRGAHGIAGALKFQARVRVTQSGGTSEAHENTVVVKDADEATLLVAVGTSYRNFKDVSGDPEATTKDHIAKAERKTFAELSSGHMAEHQRLFRRVSLDLGSTERSKLPTDERIARFAEGGDPQLAALYFQFGRYLLISCSQPGGQPANLQGLWNESMTPPWESKYTININTQMNYWTAEVANLAECVEPLVAMVEDLAESGARTAKVNYGARGWVAHHNTDLWRATAPIDGPQFGMWPTGGAWLLQNLWEHYAYNGDREYLDRIYPLLKGSAEFFLDTLVEDPETHCLVTCPSMSPENPHGRGGTLCAGPAIDQQLLRDLFAHCDEAAQILDLDADFRQKVAEARAQLAPDRIGSAGQLQEWQDDWDMTAPDIHHRHVSHLYALYPSDHITRRGTPELAEAARKSLEIRGDDATGWGLAWRLNLWARLGDGDHAYKILESLLSPQRTYPNMFDAHPPFQIDGNFGGTAGIAEMLVQSHAGELELLPALPAAWANGSVRGLRGRGGFVIDLTWAEARLVEATIHFQLGKPCRVRLGEKTAELTLAEGGQCVLDEQLRQR
jgi:alpha-L-fucosidase 2